jgi:[protein-PII] uridylyltransferase
MPIAKHAILDARVLDKALSAAAGDSAARQRVALLRDAWRTGGAAIKSAFESGTSAAHVVAAHAWLADQIVTRCYRSLTGDAGEMALLAVGGYGRGELFPYSDVDLMLLLRREATPGVAAFAEAFFQSLWDIGLEIGHSVRTVDDCVREAGKDVTVMTNIMEARLLAGDEGLLGDMRKHTGPRRIWPAVEFFDAKREEQRKRHARFGDTAYNLEPNVKDGPGGLRDLHTVFWVAQRHLGPITEHDLVAHGYFTEPEYRQLTRARNTLARVRCALHYTAAHREDRLLFDHQRTLAKQFGYEDHRGTRAVELFMKDYYRAIRELGRLNEIFLQHLEEILRGDARAKVTPINRRFQARGAYLEAVNKNVFQRQPWAMLEVFLLLQQRPELRGVRAQTIRWLREAIAHVDDKFRRDLACRSLFMEILRSPRGITHELRRMNAWGLLGAYLPVFGRIVGQMQHDLFHVYTVDEHILMVVRNLRRFTVPEFRGEFPFASELIRDVVKPERLYIAALFHDIAKGRGGDHSTLGEKDALEFCRVHGLSEYDQRFVAWLVRHHLLMSTTAQREDIYDPDVVLRFAQLVGDREHLDNLYLLTVADMRATSPKVWNVWKDRLLTQLHAAAARVLRRGLAQPFDVQARIADLKQEALALLDKDGIRPERVSPLWDRFDDDYFLRHEPDSLAWHARAIVSASAAEIPVVAARYQPGAGGTELLVYSPDRDDLFVVLTGGFDRLNLSIMDARIHTTRFGVALDTFVALDHAGDPVTGAGALAELRDAFQAQLFDPQPGRDARNAQLPRTLKSFPIETRVEFIAAHDAQSTLMEVVAQDRPGLLYQVALALAHAGARLATAKVATYGERAEDIFWITTHDHRPFDDAGAQARLRQEITNRLGTDMPEKAA